VANNVNDFEDYKNHVLGNNYTPEWAEKITGISAKDIVQIAREFMAHAPKAVYYPGRRSTFAKNDFQLRRAMAIFQALGGGIDTEGGLVFGKKLPLKGHETIAPLYAQAQGVDVDRKKGGHGYADCAVVSGGGSWIAFRNRVLEGRAPYPVRGLFVYKHNPIMNMPNRTKTEKFLKGLDLVVTIDTMPSDTVMFADVVLPECTYLERTDPVKTFGGPEPAIAVRNKVIDPMFETKPVMEIMKGLTEKISKPLFEITKKYDDDVKEDIADRGEAEVYKDYDLTQPFQHTQEELNEHAVSGYPGAAEALKKHGVYYPKMDEYFKKLSVNEHQYYPEKEKHYSVKHGKLKTRSGKVECNLKSLAKKGIDPMPTWRKEYEYSVPEGKFRMLTGRHAQFTQSGTANNAMLHDLIHENYIWINKRVAEEKGIKFGDWIEVSSSVGKVKIKAYPTEKIAPDQVFFIHGFGEESEELTWAYRSGGNDNVVIEDVVEPVYGAASMHETNVEIRKV